MSMAIRISVRVLLLNDKNELLLMRIEDFDIGTLDGKTNKRFWCTIGGGIEQDETIQEAAYREVYEETGIAELQLGPIVWHSNIDLNLRGMPTRFEETFIVARTKIQHVALFQPTKEEQAVVKQLQWFSLDDIKHCSDPIFPVSLACHLPDVIAYKYPTKPISIA